MPTLLHIDASPRGDYSISRQLSAAAVNNWLEKNPGGKVIKRDLSTSNLPYVDLEWIMGAFTPPEKQAESHKQALAISDELIGELLASEQVVIGTPMYNFTIPAVLKAWIDHVVRAGKTFSYSATGPKGLAGGRKVLVTVASGGVYEDTAGSMNYETPYLRFILGFMGMTDVSFVLVGPTGSLAPDKVSEFLAPHLEKVKTAI